MEISKDIRRLIKVGNSVFVSIPPEYLKRHNLKAGDRVEILFNKLILIKPLDEEKLREAVEKAKEALEELE